MILRTALALAFLATASAFSIGAAPTTRAARAARAANVVCQEEAGKGTCKWYAAAPTF